MMDPEMEVNPVTHQDPTTTTYLEIMYSLTLLTVAPTVYHPHWTHLSLIVLNHSTTPFLTTQITTTLGLEVEEVEEVADGEEVEVAEARIHLEVAVVAHLEVAAAVHQEVEGVMTRQEAVEATIITTHREEVEIKVVEITEAHLTHLVMTHQEEEEMEMEATILHLTMEILAMDNSHTTTSLTRVTI